MKVDGVAAVTRAGAGLGLGITRALVGRGLDAPALVQLEAHADAVHQAVAAGPGTARVEVLDVTKPDAFAFPDNLQLWIVDANFDDAGPQRYGSDAPSRASLERWRTTADEVIAGEVLSGYSGLLPPQP